MAQISSPAGLIDTEIPKATPGTRDETEASLRISSTGLARSITLRGSASLTAAMRTEGVERETPAASTTGLVVNEDTKKNQRAKANALMDAECLPLLKLFSERKTLFVDELGKHLRGPKDWLKISLLIRADFLEALDSTVRITPEGQEAWNRLRDFARGRSRGR